MKAIVSTKHGPSEVLQLKELRKPVPKENEVLVKVHAATVTQGDVMLRKLHPLLYLPMQLFGVRKKKDPGARVCRGNRSSGNKCESLQSWRPGLRDNNRFERGGER